MTKIICALAFTASLAACGSKSNMSTTPDNTTGTTGTGGTTYGGAAYGGATYGAPAK